MPSCQELFNLFLVLRAGIEPAHLSARDFKSLVSTYFTIGAGFYYTIFRINCQCHQVILVHRVGNAPTPTDYESAVPL